MVRVYIALGSNLRDPLEQCRRAIDALAALPMSTLVATSSFYRTPPYGPQDQPDFLNAVVVLDTALSPLALLDHTQRIEQEQGRERKDERWGPRTLDLDLLLFGDLTLNTERLILPHYDMHNRAFMLVPLAEVASGDLTIGENKTVSHYLASLDTSAITLW
ncbi:2-amino-4-hydroxy-6-hydroxymethyldihydropteridine diphosphokinase [Rosenbergiella australiborealis]|uniref:2-amino-4-hydroxy-6-hydroxymethyldihydropteridine pyrophosphokinase n=1 Tax=Rosenbergiella australiborealis TaxID=1544696 RepID=A0ABS5T432_9GAMM|nr:2-amino-4-hydroxy-6-hydroxymethyldihydropteridine diphosphokinase [Rosenbergiella australiborealis]MBT0726225.1 2-amino-4-hydroxy-6-hydroxymethyldihydropteridine diphosphokinase [Rosenbergiella australiborealis]